MTKKTLKISRKTYWRNRKKMGYTHYMYCEHHLKEQIEVHSDGELENWSDAMLFCERLLGYGQDFVFDE